MPLSRRSLLTASAAALPVSARAGRPAVDSGRSKSGWLFFVSNGQTVMIRADGSEQKPLSFDVPNQAAWQASGVLPGGRKALLLSLEPATFGPDRPYDRYFWQTRTHLWTYDLKTGKLDEVAAQGRMASFYTPQLVVSADRVLMQVARQTGVQIYSMNLDGSDPVEFTKLGEGVPYGFSLSPDRSQVAFHLAANGYQIHVSRPDGRERRLIDSQSGHLYFGPAWSPDGRRLAYHDCVPAQDPGHDTSDVRVADVSGPVRRGLTSGFPLWFAATYGNPRRRGSGSNMVSWSRTGEVLCSRRMPGSRVAWEYQVGRPDTDHFNREFNPERARGGSFLCRIHPDTGEWKALTPAKVGRWDFRVTESPDGRHIAFCRADTGGLPSLWVMDSDGRNARKISEGLEGAGCDHPRWL